MRVGSPLVNHDQEIANLRHQVESQHEILAQMLEHLNLLSSVNTPTEKKRMEGKFANVDHRMTLLQNSQEEIKVGLKQMAKAIHSLAQPSRKPKVKAPPVAALPMAGGTAPSVTPTDFYMPPAARRSRSMDPKLMSSSSPMLEGSDRSTYETHRIIHHHSHGDSRVTPPHTIPEGVPMDFLTDHIKKEVHKALSVGSESKTRKGKERASRPPVRPPSTSESESFGSGNKKSSETRKYRIEAPTRMAAGGTVPTSLEAASLAGSTGFSVHHIGGPPTCQFYPLRQPCHG